MHMIVVILFLFSGVLIGFLLQKRKRLIIVVDRLTTWFIYLFLLLLGISVGANEEIVKNFGKLGFQAIVLTAGAILGSVITSYFVFRIFFRKSE